MRIRGPAGDPYHVTRASGVCLLLTSPAEYKRGRTDTTHRQSNFLFVREEAPSTAPLFLPAREIRSEVYPCIFEDRRCCPMLGGISCAQGRQKFSRPIYSSLLCRQPIQEDFDLSAIWCIWCVHSLSVKRDAQFILVFSLFLEISWWWLDQSIPRKICCDVRYLNRNIVLERIKFCWQNSNINSEAALNKEYFIW